LWSAAWLALFNASLISLLFIRKRIRPIRFRARVLLAAVAFVGLAAAMLSPAQGVIVYEYGLPGTPIPWGITIDKGGAVWFTEQGTNRIAKIGEEYQIPTPGSVPWGITASKDHEDIWFTEETAGKIAKFVPSKRKFYEWTLPNPEESRPRGITMNLTKISTTNKTPQHDVWFTEYGRKRIGHLYADESFDITHVNVRFSFYEIPGGSQPMCIAMSPIDRSIWFTEYETNRISSIKVLENGSALFRHYATGGDSGLWGIGVDPDGFVWVAESKRNCIGRLNPISGEYVTFTIPTPNSEPHELVLETSSAAPYKLLNVWFTEYNGDKIGRYDPTMNVFYEYPIISTGGKPHGIAISGSIWFTEPFAQKVGAIYGWYAPPRVTTTTVGTITSAVTTSTTLATGRTNATSRVATYSAATNTTSAAAASVTSVTATYTFTSSKLLLTSTSIFSYTLTSRSTSSSFTSTTTTATQVVVSVSTIRTTTSTTATSTSVSVETSTLTTSRTSTIVLVSTSVTTTTLTATSTSNYPTITVTLANTSFIATTTFTPTVTSTSIQTSISPTTLTQTSMLTTTTTTTTTVAVTRPCIIASAAHGSELAPEVQFLREFRDDAVMSTFAGAQFMKIFNTFYYSFSPAVAEHIKASPGLAAVTRALIYPLIVSLRTTASMLPALSIDAEIGVLLMGIVASCLIGIAAVTPAVVMVSVLRRKPGSHKR
jgi:streptogramin lyase